MHKCEFCNTEFQPRPQVKKPRACSSCQVQRQRSNEKDWRSRNPRYSNAIYHELMRRSREKKLKAVIEALLECIRIGKTMSGLTFEARELSSLLTEFVLGLGVRRLNKFWSFEISM
jgi:hypothetical protein